MCVLLVGLPDVVVVGVADWPLWLRVVVTIDGERPTCSCGGAVHRHGVREVVLVDLPVFGRPTRLVWRKQRWRCTSYRTVFDTMLPDAVQVADPFHVVKLANAALDECRRRVQNETLGHRGRRDDPLWRARRRLTIARERLSPDQHDRLIGLLRAGDRADAGRRARGRSRRVHRSPGRRSR
jgi:transposase